MFDRGYWTAFRLRGIPIRLHWSIPLGAVLLSGGRIAPGIWLAFLLLILIHELGHALLVRQQGHHVEAVDIHGLGGVCRYRGHVTPRSRSLIAWGGVLGQSLLLPLGVVLSAFAVPATGSLILADAARVFTISNVLLIALNLLPVAPFDGAEAWKLFRRGGPPGLSFGRGKAPREREGQRRVRRRPVEHRPGEKVSDLLREAERRPDR